MSATAVATGLHYEELRVGTDVLTGEHRVTREEIAEFARLTGDNNPLHVDLVAARAAGFRDVLAHGPLVQALTIGLVADTGIMRGTTLALLEVSSSFLAPVLPGDTVRAVVRISRKRPTRDPRRGLLWRRITVLNQADEVVARVRMVALIRRRRRDDPSARNQGAA